MKPRLLHRKPLVSLLAVMGALILCLYLLSTSKLKPVGFQTLGEFKKFALAKGFCFPEEAGFVNSFFISDHPLGVENLHTLRGIDKRNCGLTRDWRGLLWTKT